MFQFFATPGGATAENDADLENGEGSSLLGAMKKSFSTPAFLSSPPPPQLATAALCTYNEITDDDYSEDDDDEDEGSA